jgi:asparagine synthase (glutamine-hydrolysing)
MCGIYGTTILYEEKQIREKLNRTSFRGPDQTGIKVYKNYDQQLTLGHNRLSIIDLDKRSNQPFSYYNNIHIVFNGEIFNFQLLKTQLERKGFKFKTTSDTEVICAAYLEYGENCVHQFNGMFSFVIYDENKNVLFGARDRMGQKPFYYYHNGKQFEFSSQISSIQLFNRNLSISNKSIQLYLSWGNIPDPFSIFNEIQKLKAGHSIVFNLHTGDLEIKQYWDIDYKGTNLFSGTFNQAKEELEALITNAVKIRLFADVPVGVFLSGGIDSSVISALAQKTTDTNIKTFSVKFNEKGFDESIYAQQVADYVGTDHHIIECNYKEGIDLIENFCYYYDEPFADASAIPSMLLSKYTKKQVTVALSGDAGDESFIGYHRYNWMHMANKVMRIPYQLRYLISLVLNLSPYYRHQIISDLIKTNNINDTYLKIVSGFKSTEDSSEFSNEITEIKYLYHKHKNLYERITDFDLKTYLNWDINTKVDRASMAYSLEVRSPLQDYRIVEFARSLPTRFKYHNGTMKYILKELLYDHVPKEIFDRPKAGFTMPFANWFRNELKDYILDELNYEGLSLIPEIDIQQIQLEIKEHLDGKRNRYSTIWSLLVLKQWLSNNGQGYSVK